MQLHKAAPNLHFLNDLIPILLAMVSCGIALFVLSLSILGVIVW